MMGRVAFRMRRSGTALPARPWGMHWMSRRARRPCQSMPVAATPGRGGWRDKVASWAQRQGGSAGIALRHTVQMHSMAQHQRPYAVH